ncbi:MAG: hypothetical protein L0Y56_13580, partial [Nitrospira sp.]|nr:hypothetical protein [Nitrospira sp.]
PPNNTAWYAKTWLGEIYPDVLGGINMYDHEDGPNFLWQRRGWRWRGNLPTVVSGGLAPSTNIFKMDTEDQTYLSYDGSRGTQSESPISFFNNTEKFNHTSWSNQSTYQTCRGSEMTSAFHFSAKDSIITARPFKVNQGGGTPSEFVQAPYNTPFVRPQVTLFSPYYYENTTACGATSFPNMLGSAMYQSRLDPANNGLDGDDLFGYFVINGLAPANESDPALADNPNDFLTKFNMVSMNYGFMQTGQSKNPATGANLPKNAQGVSYNSIRQLPRVEIIGPDPGDVDLLTDPSSLDVQWKISWRRWDGQLYTPDYAPDFCEKTSSLYFIPMYSTDGVNWRYVKNDAGVPRGPAPDDWRSRAPLPRVNGGKYDVAAAVPFNQEHFTLEDAASNNICNLNYVYKQVWNTASLDRDKDYILRLVVYRKDVYNHFAYHDLRIRIRS